MDPHLHRVDLNTVDFTQRFFVITEGRDSTALQHSIQDCGMLQPPCLWRSGPDAPYEIICGYLRLLALRALGHGELNAWVFDAQTPRERLLACALHDNLSHRRFNPIETARALQRLLSCFSRQAVIAQWLPRFGLAASGRLLDRWLSLNRLEPGLSEALIAGTITEASARHLCACSPEDQRAVYALMQQLHLSVGKQAELLACLDDLSRRDGITVRAVVADDASVRVCSDANLNRVQKTDAVRAILRARRYPRLLAAESRFAAAVKELPLPDGVRIVPPAGFEGEVYRAEISFTSPDELYQRSNLLAQAAQNPSARSLTADSSEPHCKDSP